MSSCLIQTGDFQAYIYSDKSDKTVLTTLEKTTTKPESFTNGASIADV